MMNDKSLMPFGKYKGQPMIKVPASYLLWLYDQKYNSVTAREVNDYIKENMDALKLEIKK